tara:strand:- start:251 stop:553 length:303 start_codon:yes stop_codon:yes gene_type:complete
MNHQSNPFYKALELRYIADSEEAIAKITLYFSQPMGVADHSDISKEIDTHLSTLSDAREKLYQLRNTFGISVQNVANDGKKKAPVASTIETSTETKKIKN